MSAVDRRSFLRRAGLASASAGVAVAGAACPASAAQPDDTAPGAPDPSDAIRFHGAHQAGITTGQQAASAFISLDVTATSRSELRQLMRTITGRVRFLTHGGDPAPVGITAPPSDSGTLGPAVQPDGLTVTVGVGASLFDKRFGLAAEKPLRLQAMPAFADDDLRPAACHGDLSLQICAHSHDTVLHAVRDIARHTRGAAQIRWKQDAYMAAPRPTGTPRNHFGFKDGTANPETGDKADMAALVWAGDDEPAWTKGGSYQVIRLISMQVEFWDRISIGEQQNIFGRNRDSGAPLDGNREFDAPDYGSDPRGSVIPLTSHIRMANPRTKVTHDSRILRRSYNYDAGVDANGNLDVGLVFVCFQQDVDRQFATVQKRLEGEPLVDYVSPFGGGYFFALPGVKDSTDFLGKALLA